MRPMRTWLERAGIPVVALGFGIVSWDLLVRTFSINPIILPPPSAVLDAFYDNAWTLLKHTGITMLEAVLGFLLGSLVAYAGAIFFVHSRLVEKALYPYAVALKSTPLIAIAPLLVVWFGNGILSKIIMSALVAFFPVLVNCVHGLSAIDEEAVHLMKSLAATRLQVLTKLRMPNSLPFLFSSLKIASSLSVVGAVIGEFTGSIVGIGHLITTSSYYLETPLMFAAIMLISAAGIAFFYTVSFIERFLIFWENPS
jgi:NitT/TauT family transport system permease protein